MFVVPMISIVFPQISYIWWSHHLLQPWQIFLMFNFHHDLSSWSIERHIVVKPSWWGPSSTVFWWWTSLSTMRRWVGPSSFALLDFKLLILSFVPLILLELVVGVFFISGPGLLYICILLRACQHVSKIFWILLLEWEEEVILLESSLKHCHSYGLI